MRLPWGESRGGESNAGPAEMRCAGPPATGMVYKSPISSNTSDWPSGETSSDIHVPSDVVNSMVRVVTSGSESARTFLPVSATADGATDGVCSGTGGKMTASRATKYQGIGCGSGSGAEKIEPTKQKRPARTALLDACLTSSRVA